LVYNSTNYNKYGLWHLENYNYRYWGP
jgi:hypothetical protein